MAELTVLEEKLAEVLGLAQAAKAATDKVSSLDRRARSEHGAAAHARRGRRDRVALHRGRRRHRRQEDRHPRQGPRDEGRGRRR